MELFHTFLFVLVYLLVIYKPSLRTVDDIIKGLGVSITLCVCYLLCAGSGACLNPALAIAQISYQIGSLKGKDANGNSFASLIWVYIIFPLIGGVIAAIWFRVHIYLDNKALEQPDSAGPRPDVV
jgi:glycerol uptake facilitator-like aquaporin